jgi:hypothetical protein
MKVAYLNQCVAAILLIFATGVSLAEQEISTAADNDLELGKQIYLKGLLPSGKAITGLVKGDISITGTNVICGTCHRRSGMGSSEGEQVIPAIAGHMIFNPLRLPTAKAPLAPEQRPAYTVESLKRAITTGIDANGRLLDPLMPRYPLSDKELDLLIGYMKTLSQENSPGVDDKEMHFATIIAGPVAPSVRKALVDVMQVYVTQKNSETRHETFRAENAPWNKKWLFEPYRKWVMHVWELKGPRETWPDQLAALYHEQPVFAVLSGVGDGSWQPMHDFCQANQVPCLFPTTDLPVIAEDDFYSIYLSKGMTLEGKMVNRHLRDLALAELPLVQVYRSGDLRAETAAKGLQGSRHAAAVKNFTWDQAASPPDLAFWQRVLQEAGSDPLVLWMDNEALANLWPLLEKRHEAAPIYLSTSLYGTAPGNLPMTLRDRVFLVHRSELPSRTARLLLRSTGWLKVKKAYAPEAAEVQANAYLALKVVGDALTHIRGYFFRDYLIERIEHSVDSAPYTSVYPRISLAPSQRFASKGGFITQFSKTSKPTLVAVTDWLIP